MYINYRSVGMISALALITAVWMVSPASAVGYFGEGILTSSKSSAYSDPSQLPDNLPLFQNVSASAGVGNAVESWGAGWGDYNTDGFLDLITYSHDFRVPEFFKNNGDGTFTNIISSTPLNAKNDRHSATWGDYDNDGDQDLIVGIGGQAGTGDHPTELFLNANGTLSNVAATAGVADGLARNRSASWADYDRDGYIDIFVANHERVGLANRLWHNNGDGTFTDKAAEAGVADNIGIHYASFVDYDRDGWSDIYVMGIAKNLLYHNQGNGTFVDVAAGTDFARGGGDTYAWGDYDNDGLADLLFVSSLDFPVAYVEAAPEQIKFTGLANKDQDGFDFTGLTEQLVFEVELLGPDDCKTVNCIYIGAGSQHPATNPFAVGTEAYGAPSYTPGVSSGYYIWRDSGTDQWHVRMSTPGAFKYGGIVTSNDPITAVVPVEIETDQPVGFTILWHNQGGGKFSRAEKMAGLELRGNIRSANWIDFDNDGYLDLFLIGQGNLAVGNLPDHLFHNNGDGTFTDVAPVVGVTGTTVGEGSVSAWADYDRDGFLDLFTQNGGNAGIWPEFPFGPNELFHNQGNGNHWIQLNLIGQTSNRSGIGAVVQLNSGGMTQTQTMDDGVSAYNQYGNPLHFGLGNSITIDTIQILWPSGVQQLLENVQADQYLSITEQQSPNNTPPTAYSQSITTIQGKPATITLTGSDPEGQRITYAVGAAPSFGSLSGSAPVLIYTPDPGFVGTDNFTFTVNDGELDSLPATVSIDVQSANLIQNGGFETDLSSWTLRQTSPAVAVFSRDESTAATGSASAKVEITTPGSALRFVQLNQSGLSLVQGTSYKLVFWAKGSIPRTIRILVRNTTNQNTIYFGAYQRLSTNWTRYELTLQVNTTDPNATLEFSLGQFASTGWLDGVELSPTSP